MTFDPNDPRLTAYLLGELDPADCAEVESMLQDSPEGRQAAEEIRLTVSWLSEQLHEEQAVQSQTARLDHQTIAAPTPSPAAAPRPWWRRKPYQLGGVAALLLLGAAVSLITITARVEPARYANYLERANALGRTPIVTRAVSPVATKRSPLAAKGVPPSRFAVDSFAVDSNSVYSNSLADKSAAPVAGAANALGRLSYAAKIPQAGLARQKLAEVRAQQRGVMVAQIDSPRDASLALGQVEGESLLRARGEQGRSLGLLARAPGKPNVQDQMRQAPTPAQASVGQVAQLQQQAGATRATKKPGQDRQDSVVPAAQVPSLPAEARQLAEAAPAAAPPAAGGERLGEQEAQAAPVAAEPEAAKDAEVFAPIVDNPFVSVSQDRQSTFSIDVDTASYSNVRRFLTQNLLPPKDAVRIEELLNYFPYNDPPPPPSSDHPFAVHVEVAGCPWNAAHRLARIGIAAKQIDQSRRPPSNLVFLVDVSGSMDAPNKLPLVQWGLQRLVEQLGENDRVAMAVYAGASGLVLPSTSCLRKAEILSAIEQLQAGGSTNGGAGLQLAYDVATQHFLKNGTNRVILATDGDFNVGITKDDELVRLIQAKAKSGVFLSVLGFGMGNLKDEKLEKLADKGNGHYAYIDSPREAYKVLVEEMGATLVTVAKDVKIQLDFNPARVSQFRLIGYENRVMAHQDFNDDTKDAGEIGAGHHVTALYELVPAGNESTAKLAVVAGKPARAAGGGPELFTVKLRYKRPNEDTSRLLAQPAIDQGLDFARASDDLKLAAAVAGFGMMLRDSPYKGSLTYAAVLEIAQPTLARDPSGYRKEFVEMVRKAQALTPKP
ncbi:MAG TPA: von Willebrand factor type A domain-containing protein [Isosphaeraceae bacterium]|nr:von Willebrand factor type A domain-containing protein [Isosphaeraceae bacterium]